jgi:hypothetical protein
LNCIKYSPNQVSAFEIVGDISTLGSYSFVLSPSVPFTSEKGRLHTLINEMTLSGSYLTVTLKANLSANIEIPLNYPPSGGALDISPKSGEPITTVFYLNTSGWSDPELPITY